MLAELSLTEDTFGLKEAYEVFKTEALDYQQDYCPVSDRCTAYIWMAGRQLIKRAETFFPLLQLSYVQ